MSRYPAAVWKGSPNYSPGGIAPIGLILHVIVGRIEDADAVFQNAGNQTSAHFGVAKDGRVWQWVDTNNRAYAEVAGNSSYWSVETEGYPTEALTEVQCQKIAELYNWLRTLVPIPYQLANAPGEHGFGTHSMGGAAWGGHQCPGDIRAGQRQHILDLAQGSQPPTQEEDDEMPYLLAYQRATSTDRPAQYVVIGNHIFGVSGDTAKDLAAGGVKTYHVEVEVYDKVAAKAE